MGKVRIGKHILGTFTGPWPERWKMSTKVCEGCGKKDCPCPVCHGNPKKHLGGSHSGLPLKDEGGQPTGKIKCYNCNRVS